jgi:hypothetical protein
VITQQRLKELLYYDPISGKWTWIKKHCYKVVVGKEAGYVNPYGYRIIQIDRHLYRAHRLAVLYITGQWPSKEIDHRFGCRDDNRWSEIREANKRQQQANAKRRSDNTSGHKGVVWDKERKCWKAQIAAPDKFKFLGRFQTFDEACQAYATAANQYFGQFARIE